MDIAAIVSELKAERNRIDGAITALEVLSLNGASSTHAVTRSKRHGGISAAGRKRISEMMKKRWAERRKKAAAKR